MDVHDARALFRVVQGQWGGSVVGSTGCRKTKMQRTMRGLSTLCIYEHHCKEQILHAHA